MCKRSAGRFRDTDSSVKRYCATPHDLLRASPSGPFHALRPAGRRLRRRGLGRGGGGGVARVAGHRRREGTRAGGRHRVVGRVDVVPGNLLAQARRHRRGIAATADLPAGDELGARYDASRIDAFLDRAPHMVVFFEEDTALQFVEGNAIPASTATRRRGTEGDQAIGPLERSPRSGPVDPPCEDDARDLVHGHADHGRRGSRGVPHDDALVQVAAACRQAIFPPPARPGIPRSRDAAVNGVALGARLAKSAGNLGVTLIGPRPPRVCFWKMVRAAARWCPWRGAISRYAGEGCRAAVGGFPNDVQRRKATFSRTPTGSNTGAAAAGCSGDGTTLGDRPGNIGHDAGVARRVGAGVAGAVRRRQDRSFPAHHHRAKPGVIGVLANGKRVVNEGVATTISTAAMAAAVPPGQEVASWLICDHRFQRRYGLGSRSRYRCACTGPASSGYPVARQLHRRTCNRVRHRRHRVGCNDRDA